VLEEKIRGDFDSSIGIMPSENSHLVGARAREEEGLRRYLEHAGGREVDVHGEDAFRKFSGPSSSRFNKRTFFF
jgi:hypothetical protein